MRAFKSCRKGEEVRKKKKWAMLLFTAAACILPAGIVLGFFSRQSTDNFLTMASYKAKLVEEYETPDHVNPAEEIDKTVRVKNEGSVAIFVRVRVEKAFGVRKKGTLVKDEGLNADVIEIDFHDTWWQKRKDGWFYYKDVLRPGETTKEPLMESYRLSPKAGNAYKGKDAQIVVSMESVQAAGGALSAWNVTEKNLGIHWEDEYEQQDTGVTFLGRTEGFSVQGDKTDLFAAFKNLVPGCGRTQKITVENRSEESVEIYLRAQESKQKNESAELRRLLTKYAVIRVEDRGKVIYEGAVCGKDSQGTMQNDISLGEFAPGEKRELEVTLSLDPAMDNSFQKLTGKVTWIFSARGEDGTVICAGAPVTGDETKTGMWAAILLLSAAFLYPAVWIKKQRGKRNDEISETGH